MGGQEKTVNDIFRYVQMNNNQKQINAFPHVPGKALNRKNSIEKILKRIQVINKPLKYQVRLGKTDLNVMIKHHMPNNYSKYIPMSIDLLDPNGEVMPWDLSSKSTLPSFSQNAVNP